METPVQVSPSPVNTPRSKRRLSSFHLPAKSPAGRLSLSVLRDTANRRLSNTPARSPHPSLIRNPSERRALLSERRFHVSARSERPDGSANQAPKGRRPILSKEEIAQMYSSTIKLCQDNKINARNTWTLNLIDYMPMLFKQDQSNVKRHVSFQEDQDPSPESNASEDTNFQLAGVTLDAGVKIYCSRVDSVHLNAFKVLGGLSRTGREDADNENGEDDGDGSTMATKKRKSKRAGGATIEANMANITAHKLETDLAVDPLFQKMSAAFDEGGARGMLLNNLPVGPSAQIIFDSAEPADNLIASDSHSQHSDATYDIASVLPKEPPNESEIICPNFLRFMDAKKANLGDAFSSVTSTADHASSHNGAQSSSAPYRDDEYSGDPNAGVDFDYDDGDLQNAGSLGIFSNTETSEPFASEPADMQFGGADGDDVNVFTTSDRVSLQSNASLAIAARGGRVDLVEAGVALREDSEYSFFDTSALSGWAGPQHWRFRATEASAQFAGGTRKARKESKRPRGKTAMLLDFSREAPKIDFEAEFAPAKTATANHLSKNVREGFSEKKVTLPEDLHFSVRSLASLFLKPKTYIRPPGSYINRQNGKSGEASEGSGWYDFDNDCDNENFCPQDDSNDMFGNGINENMQSNGDVFGSEIDLVAEPVKVDKIDINYAKVAKKVDVRQLKSGLWSRLCGEDDEHRNSILEIEGVEEKTESMQTEESCPSMRRSSVDIRGGACQTLQELVQDMPAYVPETALPDVSLSYVFICLLHLANEKTLSIAQGGEGSIQDLIISTNVQSAETPNLMESQ